ncbi:thiol:disulfide interchange protein DsbC [Modicisalibacter xianhensis]|uniref:Thiol:disulfide interchange protein n=2 Tax=Modicisalibacter xianhensis TaxID=442341 RepID=A0A4R8FN17_9GAMM|nr:thiol:disulfide interchange protein DsbC [Halomonas xianhensis]
MAACLASGAVKAQDGLGNIDFSKVEIDRVIELPIKGMSAVESNGQILFISANGRFAFSGQMFDLWYKRPVDTMAQVEDALSRIHLQQMGLEPESLNTVTMGTGSREVTIFTDPLCKACHALAEELKAFADEYTFHFVVIPALGDDSNKLAERFSCAQSKDEALTALLNGTLATLPIQSDCDTSVYQKTLMASHLMDINGVPFVIADDGRVSRGRPANLHQWLQGEY